MSDNPLIETRRWVFLLRPVQYWLWTHPFRFILRNTVCRMAGHRLGTDSGILLGARMVDRWCARCDKRLQIPMDEDPRFDQ